MVRGQILRRWRAAGVVLMLGGCSQAGEAPTVSYRAPDCSRPFADEAQALSGQPGLVAAGEVGAEPYSYYSAADGSVSYLITRKGSPAHPAILIQRAHNGVTTDGCAWGDKRAYAELKTYLESLKTWTRKGGAR